MAEEVGVFAQRQSDEWFELWDKESGNLVSDFPTFVDATEHAIEILAVNPGMDARELIIFRCTREHGPIEAFAVWE